PYSILPHSDPGRYFSISPQDGTLRTALPLDRETLAWHNLTLVATELDSPARAAPVPLAVHALDVNDNVPQLAPGSEPFICHGTAPADPDRLGAGPGRRWGGSRVTIRSPPGLGPPNITVWDNEGGPPPAGAPGAGGWGTSPPMGTPTLTLSICQSPPQAACAPASPPHCPSPPGLSAAALLAILGCGTSLLGAGRRWQGSWPGGAPRGGARAAPAEEGEVRENISSYGGRGRHPGLRHGCPAASTRPGLLPGPPARLAARLGRADADPRAPPTTRCRSTATTGGTRPAAASAPWAPPGGQRGGGG
ncbi:unnamed protein product, partial [Lepidochelys olivacea]